MVRVIGPVTVEISSAAPDLDAMGASLSSVAPYIGNAARGRVASIASLGRFLEGVSEGALDFADLLRVEFEGIAAGGACSFTINPSERYLGLVAAVARDCDGCALGTLHGWPILSSVSGSPTIAEREGGTIALPGGAA